MRGSFPAVRAAHCAQARTVADPSASRASAFSGLPVLGNAVTATARTRAARAREQPVVEVFRDPAEDEGGGRTGLLDEHVRDHEARPAASRRRRADGPGGQAERPAGAPVRGVRQHPSHRCSSHSTSRDLSSSSAWPPCCRARDVQHGVRRVRESCRRRRGECGTRRLPDRCRPVGAPQDHQRHQAGPVTRGAAPPPAPARRRRTTPRRATRSLRAAPGGRGTGGGGGVRRGRSAPTPGPWRRVRGPGVRRS